MISWLVIIFFVDPSDIKSIPVIVYDPNANKMTRSQKVMETIFVRLYVNAFMHIYVHININPCIYIDFLKNILRF